MSRGINKVILVGNLGADPETRFMPNGKTVTNLRVATSEQWKDKATGDPMERVEWHTVVLFERLAEVAAEYLRKGAQVYIEGSLRTRKWTDKDGKDRYSTEITGRELQMLGSKRADASPGGATDAQGQNPSSTGGYNIKAAEGREQARQAEVGRKQSDTFVDDELSDIPFAMAWALPLASLVSAALFALQGGGYV